MKRKIFRAAGIGSGLVVLAGAAGLLHLTTALPDAGPPPDLQVAVTPAQVERGKYLANHVAVCMDCHSKRDYSRFPGPVIPLTGATGWLIRMRGRRFVVLFYQGFYRSNTAASPRLKWVRRVCSARATSRFRSASTSRRCSLSVRS